MAGMKPKKPVAKPKAPATKPTAKPKPKAKVPSGYTKYKDATDRPGFLNGKGTI